VVGEVGSLSDLEPQPEIKRKTMLKVTQQLLLTFRLRVTEGAVEPSSVWRRAPTTT